jgi:heme/copper-type cytochrome/quinol oxidase subunit 2
MIFSLNRKKFISEVFLAVVLWLNFFQPCFVFADVPEKYQMTFQDPATPVMEALIDFHHDLMFILIIIGCLVFWLVYRTFFLFEMLKVNRQLVPVEMRVKLILAGVRFGPNKNLVTILRFNKSKYLEIIWTVLPFLTILTIMPASFALLYSMDDLVRPSVTIKCIGNQWFWNYNIADTRKILVGDDHVIDDFDSLYSSYVQLLESKSFNYRFSKRFFPFLDLYLNKDQKNMLNYVIDNNISTKDEMLAHVNNKNLYVLSVLDFLDNVVVDKAFEVFSNLDKGYKQILDADFSKNFAWYVANEVRFFVLTNQIFFKAFFDFFDHFEKKDFCLSCSLIYTDRGKIRNTAFFSENYFTPLNNNRKLFYDEFFKYLDFSSLYQKTEFDPYLDPFYKFNSIDFFSFDMFDIYRLRLIDFDLFFNFIVDRSKIFFSAFNLIHNSPVFAEFDADDILLFNEIIGEAWFSYIDFVLYNVFYLDPLFQGDSLPTDIENTVESVADFLGDSMSNDEIKIIINLDDDFYGQNMSNSKEIIVDFLHHLDLLFANFFSSSGQSSTIFISSKKRIEDLDIDVFLDTIKVYLTQFRYSRLDKLDKFLLFMDTNLLISWYFDLNALLVYYIKTLIDNASKVSLTDDAMVLENRKILKGYENVKNLYLTTFENLIELDHVFNEFKTTLSENIGIFYELYLYLYILNLNEYREIFEYFFLTSFDSFSAGILSNQSSFNFQYSDASFDLVQNYLNVKKLFNNCFDFIKESFLEFFEDTLLICNTDDLFYKFKIQKLNFDSIMVPEDDLLLGQHRLLDVEKNNILVVPSHTNIRLLITSRDVLHSWAVPSFGIKMDACPGRLNQVGLFVKRFGKFYGQCSEICGINHGFMPIVVKSVDPNSFLTWMENKKNMDIYFPESKSN